MKLREFEQKCALAKLKILKRETIDDICVIIADGFSNGTSEMSGSHYRTVYALGNNSDDLKIMQSVYHEWGEGFGFSDKQQERIDDAFAQAQKTIEGLKNGGIFKSH